MCLYINPGSRLLLVPSLNEQNEAFNKRGSYVKDIIRTSVAILASPDSNKE